MAKEKPLLNSAKKIKRRDFIKIAARLRLPPWQCRCLRRCRPISARSTRSRPLKLSRASRRIPRTPGRDFPTRPFFGDTHTHTSFSMDAGAFGARLGPADAYRFGKGQEVVASSGQRVKLSRPLDFMVVSDHSDNMGFFPDLFAGKPEMLADPTGRGGTT